ncbi:MAG: beta-L-arabinofuranosidase domain-containing protein [Mangrovibacterium sp.]
MTGEKQKQPHFSGSSRHNEGFTKDYDLPNKTAYCKTCASIGMVFWNNRVNLLLDMPAELVAADPRVKGNVVKRAVGVDGHGKRQKQ